MKGRLFFAFIAAPIISYHAVTYAQDQDIVLAPPPPQDPPFFYQPDFEGIDSRDDHSLPYFFKEVQLWGTSYQVHVTKELVNPAGGIRIRDKTGTPIAPAIALKDFCQAALQGTVAIYTANFQYDDSPETKIYNSSGLTKEPYADCTPYFKKNKKLVPNLNRQAFFAIEEKYGQGARSSRLIPYRSIAVDPKFIPLGQVLFIPRLRGFQTPFGPHDGFVIANDVGGGIKGNHIDLFVGYEGASVPDFIKSKSDFTFDAYFISEEKYKLKLKRLVNWKAR